MVTGGFMLHTILALLVAHTQPGSVPAKQLAPAILEAAHDYGVSAEVLTRIIIVESKAREYAINDKTHDYGLMQINIRTANTYGVSSSCLLNWKCNLRVGALIIKDMQRSSRYRPCMYNVGNRVITLNNACLRYESKLANLGGSYVQSGR